MGNFTDYLVARPSFLDGYARLFDFGNTLCEYNYSRNEEEADQIAMWLDWNAVGADIRRAYQEFVAAQESKQYATSQ